MFFISLFGFTEYKPVYKMALMREIITHSWSTAAGITKKNKNTRTDLTFWLYMAEKLQL